MDNIPQEVIDQMVELVRELHAAFVQHGAHDNSLDFAARIAAIVTLLPEPVDPDLIEARAMAADSMVKSTTAIEFRRGLHDNWPPVLYRLEGIKRGRELAARS